MDVIKNCKVREMAFCTFKEMKDNHFFPVMQKHNAITSYLLKKAVKKPQLEEKSEWENIDDVISEWDKLYFHHTMDGNLYCMRYIGSIRGAILYRVASEEEK